MAAIQDDWQQVQVKDGHYFFFSFQLTQESSLEHSEVRSISYIW